MKKLLEFLLKGVLADKKFEITESKSEMGVSYLVKTDPENVGLIIGKGGRMIHSLRSILKVRATLEKSAVSLEITE